MTKVLFFLLGSLVPVAASAQTIHSPNHKLALRFALSPAGEPTYQLTYGTKPVFKPSRLGVLGSLGAWLGR
jgi:glucan 1,4-alpha-glucosidase